ncbi:hypothetical protein BLNAU_3307 [Blattamonas nauphoetae]|uniref:Uncharacterized protein n=1 Tax=Blattamonas nauphoetae TaxID=2049346 RepID=A0ABQ9YDM6_9EUKA|nr:hypothetical protein BLNAU_3307 [Blattamonas nauphoetae]
MDHRDPHRVVDGNRVFKWLCITSCGCARTARTASLINPAYYPFLEWYQPDPYSQSYASFAPPFISLVILVGDGIRISKDLVSKASKLLSSISEYLDNRTYVNEFLKAIGKGYPDPAAVILEVSAFHKPTLDFVCSSHIPIVFQSHLSKVEDDYQKAMTLANLSHNIDEWKKDGGDTVSRGRTVMQTLEQEGFRNGCRKLHPTHNQGSSTG